MLNGTSSIFKGRNYTDEERRLILADIQHQMTIIMLPSIFFLCLVFIIGVIGNPLVIFVYTRRFSISPLRTYVKMAAVYDLLANLIVIPGDISDIFNWWNYDQPYLCKARRFAYSTISMSSALLLLAIAVARYTRVCRPFSKQLNMTHVNISMIFVIGLPMVCSIGYSILNGRQSKMTSYPGVKGYFCSIDDSYVQTKWPMIHACFFMLLFLSGCVPLVVLYALIGAKTWRHQRSLMAASWFKISEKTGIAGTNTAKASETNDYSTTGTLETVDFSDSMMTTNVVERFENSNIKTNETNRKEIEMSRKCGKMRTLKMETSCANDRDKCVGSYLIGDQLQNLSETHTADVSETETQKADVSISETRKGEVSISYPQKVDSPNFKIKKNGINKSDQLMNDSVNEETHRFDFKYKVDNFEITSLRDDHIRENLSMFQPKGPSTQNIGTTSTMFKPHAGLIPSSNATLSDGGVSLLVETPRDSLQRNQSFWLNLPLPRKDEHSGRPKQLHTAREKGVHTSRSFDRTTRMLLAISVVFIFTYLPFVCLELLKHAAPGTFASLNDASLSVYYLFWRSYLLNSCANPIIYCLYDVKFRRESLKTVLNLLPFKKS